MILQSVGNPLAIQSGVVNPMHIANAYKRFFQELDIPDWEELVSTPEQVMQRLQQQQQQPPPDDVKLRSDDLTESELAQVLVKRGINPDVAERQARAFVKGREKSTSVEKTKAETQKLQAELLETIGGREKVGGE
jgi:hypothetical protein